MMTTQNLNEKRTKHYQSLLINFIIFSLYLTLQLINLGIEKTLKKKKRKEKDGNYIYLIFFWNKYEILNPIHLLLYLPKV